MAAKFSVAMAARAAAEDIRFSYGDDGSRVQEDAAGMLGLQVENLDSDAAAQLYMDSLTGGTSRAKTVLARWLERHAQKAEAAEAAEAPKKAEKGGKKGAPPPPAEPAAEPADTETPLPQWSITDAYGKTLLMRAASRGHAELCTILMHAGADLTVACPHGHTALHHCAAAGHADVVALILEHGAAAVPAVHVAPSSRDGMTPLHEAAAGGHVEAVEKLLGAGAPVDAKDLCGTTPLMLAAAAGHASTCAALAAAGAAIEARDENGCSALLHAAAHGGREVCESLVDAGASLHAASNGQRTVGTIDGRLGEALRQRAAEQATPQEVEATG